MSKRLGEVILGCKDKPSSFSPVVVTFGQQYNVGEKPIILFICINRHAGTQNKTQNNVVHNQIGLIIIYDNSAIEPYVHNKTFASARFRGDKRRGAFVPAVESTVLEVIGYSHYSKTLKIMSIVYLNCL